MNATPIERVARPTFERFTAEYLRAARPVVVTGAMESWPALERWSFEHLGLALGSRRVKPMLLSSGAFHLGETGLEVREMGFDRYLEALAGAGAPPLYLRHELTGRDRELERELQTPEYCRRRLVLKRNLWVGGAGTRSGLHYDLMHNLVAQVTGRRRATLFASRDTANLYPYPARSLHWHHSQVRLESVDRVRFPRFAMAQPLEAELVRGEMLFIPQGFWHCFETLLPSIAVNFFWLTKRHLPQMAGSKLLWLLRGITT
jgi:lysine-specific demethylase 8